MQWSMPHRVLQVVASLIVLVAILAFSLGVYNAPQRGRMPGEKSAGSAGAPLLTATDATPLSQDRIEGQAPRELTPEEKEKAQEEKEARQEAADAVRAAAATAPPGVTVVGSPSSSPAEKAGEAAQSAAPAQEEAPH